MQADGAITSITVFGGTGFIGRVLVRALAARGARVVVPTSRPQEALFLRTAGEVGQIVILPCRVREENDLRLALCDAHAAVNLIGILYERRDGDFAALHAALPGRIARMAKVTGVRQLVHVSAIGANAANPSHYARSKAAGEQALRQQDPEAVILRPSVVFGPEDAFLNRFARLARFSPVLPLIGGGKTRLQPVYVGDVAQAVVAALTLPESKGHIYELGGPNIYSFRDLMVYLLKLMGKRRCLVPVPFALACLQGAVLQMLPHPPLTVDQVNMLKHDNVVSPDLPGLTALNIAPTALEAVAPSYLKRAQIS